MNEHIASRAQRLITTSKGITIGAHYLPPPPMPSADAEAIQQALLDAEDKRRNEWHAKVAEVFIIILAAGAALAAIFGKFN